MTATVIRAADRHHWANEWLTSRQSFPGTGNFDIFDNAHGVLAMHNDDVVDSGEGLDAHQHQNMEIVTWVVDGAVAHRDSHGHTETLQAGHAGAMTAGRGISHSERNAADRSSGQSLRVIQMWVPPHTDGLEPAHSSRDFNPLLADGEPVVVASGRPEHAGGAALHIANRYATLHIARPHAGQTITLPGAPFGHLFVVHGEVTATADDLASTVLTEGDAVRLADAGQVTVTATADTEIVYWEMHAEFASARPA
ncbi:pirin family protein [Gordonia neofelifaecis]|uniref:Pirin domain-containing protein n=1 Tax=Gordonia neofelifaecis NRRL B-59395 TaxID=644548 RepID=F1YF33_9ACTN|nr:pirin family protein [Gordonia neofelifaecis]EGD56373.1 Pirin domain-containing protein [Gordonia neofelifaecis NRRL B-59395]